MGISTAFMDQNHKDTHQNCWPKFIHHYALSIKPDKISSSEELQRMQTDLIC